MRWAEMQCASQSILFALIWEFSQGLRPDKSYDVDTICHCTIISNCQLIWYFVELSQARSIILQNSNRTNKRVTIVFTDIFAITCV